MVRSVTPYFLSASDDWRFSRPDVIERRTGGQLEQCVREGSGIRKRAGRFAMKPRGRIAGYGTANILVDHTAYWIETVK